MAKSMNKVILVGNVGNDPEMKKVGNDVLANLSLATSTSWKDKASGEWREKTQWHKVIAWRYPAEQIEKYVTKGTRLLVEGSIEYRTWEDREGNKRYSTEINAYSIIVLSEKKKSDAPVAKGNAEAPAAREGFDDFPEALDAEDDDLPF